ncbi:GNAT family N-acetyltransferase [Cellulomonas sp. PhB150]|uniref:GNAT family N-acetyltransferase n=1 Tax=Cellulomonas sp. PhB150 TaxID=2485188 RepID=UPI000FA163D7|nr:GNAT family N-acetyltransferase [Cellulomonas sp. PhB150]ROS31601.1 ribosomal protein S18 acetylase RimI-like enzyme [Cellulomonas sp. PhB150]
MLAGVPVEIRPAQATDVEALARLAALTFPLACPPGSTAQDQQAFIDAVLSPERFADYVADQQRVVLVAQSDDDLVGYTMLVAGEPADPDVRAALTIAPTIELSKCYVHPDHHGAGTAAALMDRSLDEGRARTAGGMWLGVNQLNARARRFYERHGFAVVGVKHFQVGGRLEDDYVLERAL